MNKKNYFNGNLELHLRTSQMYFIILRSGTKDLLDTGIEDRQFIFDR